MTQKEATTVCTCIIIFNNIFNKPICYSVQLGFLTGAIGLKSYIFLGGEGGGGGRKRKVCVGG